MRASDESVLHCGDGAAKLAAEARKHGADPTVLRTAIAARKCEPESYNCRFAGGGLSKPAQMPNNVFARRIKPQGPNKENSKGDHAAPSLLRYAVYILRSRFTVFLIMQSRCAWSQRHNTWAQTGKRRMLRRPPAGLPIAEMAVCLHQWGAFQRLLVRALPWQPWRAAPTHLPDPGQFQRLITAQLPQGLPHQLPEHQQWRQRQRQRQHQHQEQRRQRQVPQWRLQRVRIGNQHRQPSLLNAGSTSRLAPARPWQPPQPEKQLLLPMAPGSARPRALHNRSIRHRNACQPVATTAPRSQAEVRRRAPTPHPSYPVQ